MNTNTAHTAIEITIAGETRQLEIAHLMMGVYGTLEQVVIRRRTRKGTWANARVQLLTKDGIVYVKGLAAGEWELVRFA